MQEAPRLDPLLHRALGLKCRKVSPQCWMNRGAQTKGCFGIVGLPAGSTELHRSTAASRDSFGVASIVLDPSQKSATHLVWRIPEPHVKSVRS
jgi:hypothetical protein